MLDTGSDSALKSPPRSTPGAGSAGCKESSPLDLSIKTDVSRHERTGATKGVCVAHCTWLRGVCGISVQ